MSGTSCYINMGSSSCSSPLRTPTDIYDIILLSVYSQGIPTFCLQSHIELDITVNICTVPILVTGTVNRNGLFMWFSLESIEVNKCTEIITV